jgi:hypothetical protein
MNAVDPLYSCDGSKLAPRASQYPLGWHHDRASTLISPILIRLMFDAMLTLSTTTTTTTATTVQQTRHKASPDYYEREEYR